MQATSSFLAPAAFTVLTLQIACIPAFAADGDARLRLSPAASPGSELSVESWSWGPPQPGPVAALAPPALRRTVPPRAGEPSKWGEWIADVERPASTAGETGLAKGAGRSNPITHPAFPQYEVKTARDAGSGIAPGKRGLQPLEVGSLTVRLKTPWPDCVVGRRFDGAALLTEQRYELIGVELVRCDGALLTLNYAALVPAED